MIKRGRRAKTRRGVARVMGGRKRPRRAKRSKRGGVYKLKTNKRNELVAWESKLGKLGYTIPETLTRRQIDHGYHKWYQGLNGELPTKVITRRYTQPNVRKGEHTFPLSMYEELLWRDSANDAERIDLGNY